MSPRCPSASGGRRYEALKDAALGDLLDTVWLQGQAAEMGIVVTPRQVGRQLARIKRENFESGAEYRRFLREAHLTRRDVRERVELTLLSSRDRDQGRERRRERVRSAGRLQAIHSRVHGEVASADRLRVGVRDRSLLERTAPVDSGSAR